MANEVATIQTRLPMPQREGIEAGYWKVLCETAFPLAKSTEAIVMALDYCKARKLDPLKKMVHIVPMWNSALGRMVETVWPGIAEVQTTAARTGKYAGMDEPKFGNEVTRTFKGKKNDKDVGEASITLTFPEWCSVTVYRIVDGQKCAFTEPVYWLEAYARTGKNTELPNDQWAKRPRGMIIKVAKAFSLRAAFPEEADYTGEEMAGRSLDDYETTIEGFAIPQEPVEAKSVWKTATLRNTWFKSVVDSFESAKTLKELKAAVTGHKPKFDEMVENGNEHDLLAVDELRKRYEQIQTRLKEEAEIDQTNYLDEGFNRQVSAGERKPHPAAIAGLDDEIPDFGSPELPAGTQAGESTPSVVANPVPSLATIELKKTRGNTPQWKYWRNDAIAALNALEGDAVGAWLKLHDKQLEALKVVNEDWYKQVNEVAIERMG